MQKIAIIAAFIFTLSACQKIINIDLNSSNPTIVIEAGLTDLPLPAQVKLSLTTDYFNPSYPKTVSGAVVTISDDANITETLKEISPGLYQTAANFQGVGGHTYFLNVQSNGKTYTSQSNLNKPIPLDSLTYQLDPTPRGVGKIRYLVLAHFNDPIGKGNAYRFLTQIKQAQASTDTSNAKPDLSYRLFSDRLQDGEKITYQIRRAIELNDTMQVTMLSFDQKVYDYYNTLNAITGGQQAASAAPSNPNSNITGGALGYFAAFSVNIKSIVAK